MIRTGSYSLRGITYRTEGSVIIAENAETLGLFKGVQRANNASLSLGGTKLVVDGRLGPKTFASVQVQCQELNKISTAQMPSWAAYVPRSLDSLANDASTVVEQMSGYADRNISVSSAILATDYRPAGTKPDPPALPDKPKSSTMVYVAGGLLAVGAALLWGGGKKKKRRKR